MMEFPGEGKPVLLDGKIVGFKLAEPGQAECRLERERIGNIIREEIHSLAASATEYHKAGRVMALRTVTAKRAALLDILARIDGPKGVTKADNGEGV